MSGKRGGAALRGLMAIALSISAAAANAVLLAPGGVAALPGTTVAAEPQLAGVVLEDELVPFAFAADGGSISGRVQVRVVRSSVDNTLDFYWRVFNSAESSGVIGSFRIGDFVASAYDANWRIDGLGDVAPETARRFSGTRDSFVNFNFGDQLLPGLTSRFMFLDTDATDYARNAAYDLTNFGQTQISQAFTMFGPVRGGTVPEPGSLALLCAAGLAGATLARRRTLPAA